MILRIKIKESSETLLNSIKAEKDGNKKDKLKLLKMVANNEVNEIKEASEKLFRHRNTISDWLKKYRKGGINKLLEEQDSGRKKGSLKYFNQEDLDLLKKALDDEKGFSSYKEIQLWVLKELKIKIPYHTLWHLIRKDLKAKLKVPRPINVKKDLEKEQDFKKNFRISKTKTIR